MKKLALLPAALMIVSMLALAGPATAATPYPGTVATHTGAALRFNSVAAHHGRDKKHGAAVVSYRIQTSGNARPVGSVVFLVFRHHKLYEARTVTYRGPSTKHLTHLVVGTYRIVVTFHPRSGTVWKASSKTLHFTVTR